MISGSRQSVRVSFFRRQGFTLVELMAVIAIIAVAMGMASSMGVKMYHKLLVEKAARDIFGLMRYGKIAAIETQQVVTLNLDKENKRAWLEVDRVDPGSGAMNRQVIRNSFCKPATLGAGVTFEQLLFTGQETNDDSREEASQAILFSPNGAATDVIVQVGNERHHYAVILNATTGRARLLAGEAKGQVSDTIDLDQQ